MTEPFVRLLVADLDGTLLAPGGILSDRVRDAVATLTGAGVRVVLASGRVPHAMRRICGVLGLSGPQIAMQGSLVADPETEEVLASWPLSRGDVLEHLAFARSVGAQPLLCLQAGFLTESMSPEVEALFAPYDEPLPAIVPDLASRADDAIVKTFLYTPPGTYDAVWGAAHAHFGGRYTITSGDEHSVELLHPEASKGGALRVVAAHFGVPLARTAAIGDGRNDILMLQAAGRSAAMAQARPEVRDAADVVVPGNLEDGAVEAIAWFFPELFPGAGAAAVPSRAGAGLAPAPASVDENEPGGTPA